MARKLVTSAIALVVGALLGVGVTVAAVGLLPFALGGTLVCSVNGDDTVTNCTSDGHQVTVPHHIRIRQ